jgi:hypothetical protein
MTFKPVEPSKSPKRDAVVAENLKYSVTRTVDDHDLLRSFLLAKLVQDEVDSFTEYYTISAYFLRGADMKVRNGRRLDVVQDIARHALSITAGSEVINRNLDWDDIVAMSATFDTLDAGCHNTFRNH